MQTLSIQGPNVYDIFHNGRDVESDQLSIYKVREDTLDQIYAQATKK